MQQQMFASMQNQMQGGGMGGGMGGMGGMGLLGMTPPAAAPATPATPAAPAAPASVHLRTGSLSDDGFAQHLERCALSDAPCTARAGRGDRAAAALQGAKSSGTRDGQKLHCRVLKSRSTRQTHTE